MAEHPPFPSPGEPAPGPLDHSGPAAVPGANGDTGEHRESLTAGADQTAAEQPTPTPAEPTGAALEQPPGSASDDPPPAPVPPRSQDADDAVFRELIARFDDEPTTRTWPSQEDVADPRRPTIIILRPPFEPDTPADPADQTEPGAAQAGLPPGVRPHQLRGDDDEIVVIDLGADSAETGSPDGDDDHYVPPPPPPLPRIRPVTRWAIGSIALGVVFLMVPSLIGFNQSRSQDVAGVLLILGGVGTLVARMGDRPPTDPDGPDDGAVL
ncbi:hypothetical protein MXD61_05125 [Frankia sp. AgPm24]|uniref:hypothetical protein n=1 Tax=Frankia sp. AgPm24 TaxID=631128 RepID=UPI00200EFB10|nr:hypothetical protein [Frankia sp. AgPm24]MCK9921288.1 hypothetical protein [Frankia sp. AgPm24]